MEAIGETAAVLGLLCKTYVHLLSRFLRSHAQQSLAVVPVVAANPVKEVQMDKQRREAMGAAVHVNNLSCGLPATCSMMESSKTSRVAHPGEHGIDQLISAIHL